MCPPAVVFPLPWSGSEDPVSAQPRPCAPTPSARWSTWPRGQWKLREFWSSQRPFVPCTVGAAQCRWRHPPCCPASGCTHCTERGADTPVCLRTVLSCFPGGRVSSWLVCVPNSAPCRRSTWSLSCNSNDCALPDFLPPFLKTRAWTTDGEDSLVMTPVSAPPSPFREASFLQVHPLSEPGNVRHGGGGRAGHSHPLLPRSPDGSEEHVAGLQAHRRPEPATAPRRSSPVVRECLVLACCDVDRVTDASRDGKLLEEQPCRAPWGELPLCS